MIESKVVEGKAKPLGNYPHVKRVGDFVYISGTSSRRPDNTHVGAVVGPDGDVVLSIKDQTKAVIENIINLLVEAGGKKEDLIDLTTFLVDMDDFPGYNEVYGQFFDHTGPTRTTVAVYQLPHPNLLIEIKAIAYLPIK